jgi:hypothetical protein
MKDAKRRDLDNPTYLPNTDSTMEFTLNALYDNDTRKFGSNVIPGLTFEELIGTLLSARKEIRTLRGIDEMLERLP